MRNLQRNCRTIYFANRIGENTIFDEYGNDTLEIETFYGPPAPLRVNVSASVGQEAVETFGGQTEYSRTVCVAGECPLVEGSKVWFGISVEDENNYVVVRVADSKNGYLVALREVSAR